MPAAAVIPALLLNQTTVAVKKFVVAFDMHMCLYNLLYFHMCMYECAPNICFTFVSRCYSSYFG